MGHSRFQFGISGLRSVRRLNLENPIEPDFLYEGWIVAHDEKRTVEAPQSDFQQFDRIDVEMVCRFIQNDKPWWRRA